MTRFRSITLVAAIVLLAAGALTGIHLLNTSTAAPLPAQLSTSDAGGQPGTVPPVEQIPPAPDAPHTAQAPAGSAGAGAAPESGPTNPAPAQRPATTQPDRPSGNDSGGGSGSGSGSGSDHDSDRGSNGGPDRWHGGGGPGQWHDPDGFPRRDQYPFRDRQPGFGGPGPGGPGPGGPGPGGPGPGFGGQQRPGQASGQAPGGGGLTPAQRDQARQQVANALCDRYHLPRERCQIDATGR